jgi:hypothetical protein
MSQYLLNGYPVLWFLLEHPEEQLFFLIPQFTVLRILLIYVTTLVLLYHLHECSFLQRVDVRSICKRKKVHKVKNATKRKNVTASIVRAIWTRVRNFGCSISGSATARKHKGFTFPRTPPTQNQ